MDTVTYIKSDELKYMRVMDCVFSMDEFVAMGKDEEDPLCLNICLKTRDFFIHFDSETLRDSAFEYIWLYILRQKEEDNG